MLSEGESREVIEAYEMLVKPQMQRDAALLARQLDKFGAQNRTVRGRERSGKELAEVVGAQLAVWSEIQRLDRPRLWGMVTARNDGNPSLVMVEAGEMPAPETMGMSYEQAQRYARKTVYRNERGELRVATPRDDLPEDARILTERGLVNLEWMRLRGYVFNGRAWVDTKGTDWDWPTYVYRADAGGKSIQETGADDPRASLPDVGVRRQLQVHLHLED